MKTNYKHKLRFSVSLLLCIVLTVNICCAAFAITVETVTPAPITAGEIPEYNGSTYAEINGNKPYFDIADYECGAYVKNSPKDKLGRTGAAMGCLCAELMPTEPRGEIGSIKPTGWHTVHYECVSGLYLYNRSHIIGYQLGGANTDSINLFTGTSRLNKEGMLLFENETAEYIKVSGNHVLYRATPIYLGDNLVASGIVLEAISVEDKGVGLCFNVFVYNVQPGVVIDYATGDSRKAEDDNEVIFSVDQTSFVAGAVSETEPTKKISSGTVYVLNTNTHKFHLPGCYTISGISPENLQERSCSRDELIAEGYTPCKRCNS